MLNNNLDIVVEQVNQHRQELMAAAEQQYLVQCASQNQPGILAQTLTYVGSLLVTSGQWLKAHGELPTTSRPAVMR